MESQALLFVRKWLSVVVTLAALIVTFNIVMDPYLFFGMPRISGFNARKPAVDIRQRMMKAYDVLRAEPRTLILGSSRPAVGIDATSTAWPEADRPVYNLTFGSGSPYMAYRYLQHVSSAHRLSMVVVGLDFEYFLAGLHPENLDFEPFMRVQPDGSASPVRRQYIRDFVQSTLTFHSLKDSAATLAGSLRNASSDVVAGNWHWYQELIVLSMLGAYDEFAVADLQIAPNFRGRQRDPRAFDAVRRLLDLCRTSGTRVVLFINPSHAHGLEIQDLSGQWSAFEQWVRDLVALASQYSNGASGNAVPLWDFTGYTPYTTEVPLPDTRVAKWFIDPDHYSLALGEIIVRRMFGDSDEPFGVLLTPANIEPHLAEIRAQRAQYRAQHPAEVRRVRELYDLANRRN